MGASSESSRSWDIGAWFTPTGGGVFGGGTLCAGAAAATASMAAATTTAKDRERFIDAPGKGARPSSAALAIATIAINAAGARRVDPGQGRPARYHWLPCR